MSFDLKSQCFVCGHKINPTTCYNGSYHGFDYNLCVICCDMITLKVSSVYGCKFVYYSFTQQQKILFEYVFKVQRFNLGKYKAIKQSEEILNC